MSSNRLTSWPGLLGLRPARSARGSPCGPALVRHSGGPRSKGLGVADWDQWVHVTEGPTCTATVAVGTVSRGGRLAGAMCLGPGASDGERARSWPAEGGAV